MTEPQAHARNADPVTSHQAAESVTNMRTLHSLILGVLVSAGPLTDEGIAENFSYAMFSPSGLRSRRAELVRMGLVRDSGERKLTRSGRKTIVWEAV